MKVPKALQNMFNHTPKRMNIRTHCINNKNLNPKPSNNQPEGNILQFITLTACVTSLALQTTVLYPLYFETNEEIMNLNHRFDTLFDPLISTPSSNNTENVATSNMCYK